MPFLSHAGVSLRYDRVGAGPAVLFVHGWTCNRTFWKPQVQAFRDRYTVITVDLRGHGESSRPRTGYTIGAVVGDLEHLVRALAVPGVALVGWSMGGVLAQELARRLGDRVTALGLVCTPAGGLTHPKTRRAEAERTAEIESAIAAHFREFTRRFAVNLFKAGMTSPLYPWAVRQVRKTPPHVAAACFDAPPMAETRRHLRELRVPTAVMHGRHDTVVPLGNGEYLASHIPGARLMVFEESGHAPFLEEPEAFNAALRALLAAEPPSIEPSRAREPEAAALRTERAGRTGAAGKGRARRVTTARRPAKQG